ncbi:hypothetical protein SAMN05216214_113103 [Atopomonas hussainii]|uniref:Uncharacterized protein n=1 Tax=Atopomonas hussainii TaxID=1429083 RepID=A0A1H7QX32_9GAMM|nr:hypothetical protein [Atopomonas hussainii]SEL52483.1 hypothetical protein SAMN05216214_113103 [Atopomonas hussainii]
MKIQGRIGDTPVELEVTFEPHEWAQLAACLAGQGAAPAAGNAPLSAPLSMAEQAQQAVANGDKLLTLALQVLAAHGECDGPTLRSELLALAGSDVEAKRLLVRLRHHPQVVLREEGSAPIYRWQEKPC